ncbi:hypothetical protein WN943_019522 [Citrus x changshan-huyou]
MVKFSMFYFLEVALLGKEYRSSIIRDHSLHIDNFEIFNKYPWGRVCSENTLESMKNVIAIRKNKERANPDYVLEKEAYNLHGCPFAVQLKVLEKLDVGDEIEASHPNLQWFWQTNWLQQLENDFHVDSKSTKSATLVLEQKSSSVVQKNSMAMENPLTDWACELKPALNSFRSPSMVRFRDKRLEKLEEFVALVELELLVHSVGVLETMKKWGGLSI